MSIPATHRPPIEHHWPTPVLAALADPLLAQSAIDRLQSTAWELVVEGESYRRRQKPTLNPPETTQKETRR